MFSFVPVGSLVVVEEARRLRGQNRALESQPSMSFVECVFALANRPFHGLLGQKTMKELLVIALAA